MIAIERKSFSIYFIICNIHEVHCKANAIELFEWECD